MVSWLVKSCLFGYEDYDIEHFRVAALGSVIAEEPFKKNHDELSPVKLVAASKIRQTPPCTGDAGIRGSRTIPRKSDEDSDIETEPPANTHVVSNRKCEWPHPAPSGHHDVEKWDSMWLNNICLGNPQNHERERLYWEKCFQWTGGDDRLSEAITPADMLALDSLIREKIKKVA